MNSSVTSLAAPVIPACRANTYNARSPSAKPHWGRSEREHTTSAAACNFAKRRCGERKGPSPLPRFAFPRSIHHPATPRPAPPRRPLLSTVAFHTGFPAHPRIPVRAARRRAGTRPRAPGRAPSQSHPLLSAAGVRNSESDAAPRAPAEARTGPPRGRPRWRTGPTCQRRAGAPAAGRKGPGAQQPSTCRRGAVKAGDGGGRMRTR